MSLLLKKIGNRKRIAFLCALYFSSEPNNKVALFCAKLKKLFFPFLLLDSRFPLLYHSLLRFFVCCLFIVSCWLHDLCPFNWTDLCVLYEIRWRRTKPSRMIRWIEQLHIIVKWKTFQWLPSLSIDSIGKQCRFCSLTNNICRKEPRKILYFLGLFNSTTVHYQGLKWACNEHLFLRSVRRKTKLQNSKTLKSTKINEKWKNNFVFICEFSKLHKDSMRH